MMMIASKDMSHDMQVMTSVSLSQLEEKDWCTDCDFSYNNDWDECTRNDSNDKTSSQMSNDKFPVFITPTDPRKWET